MLWCAALLLLQLPVLDLPKTDRNPHTSAADVEQGRKLFAGRCAGCHGPTGDGGKGANLAVPVLPRAADDLSLYRVIRYGIPDTEMPRSLLAPREVWQIAAYVRGLGRIERQQLPGDPERGRALAAGKGGCLQCHAIGTEGGRMGPPLHDIGVRRSPGHIRTKLIEPQRAVPDDFRLVELRTRAGRKVSGVRLNEDTFSIQLRDYSDGLHSFWKQDLAELKVEKRTPMPGYRGRLSDAELDDVLAWLAGLRGY
jgi:cytochrome c oxidase cbb3-type subunit III